MSSLQEVQRIRAIYRKYDQSHTVQNRWTQQNAGNRAIRREWRSVLQDMLQKNGKLPLTNRSILEVGCGSGAILSTLHHWGAQSDKLCGIDLLDNEIRRAKHSFPEAHFQQMNGEQLAFQDATFDHVLLFTVFTSILDQHMARAVAMEVRRVIKPGGSVIWYDFRFLNPRNPHVRKMTVEDIQSLFPDFAMQLRTVTLLPPLARRLGRATPLLYPFLAAIPFLRTHYIGLLTKPHK